MINVLNMPFSGAAKALGHDALLAKRRGDERAYYLLIRRMTLISAGDFRSGPRQGLITYDRVRKYCEEYVHALETEIFG